MVLGDKLVVIGAMEEPLLCCLLTLCGSAGGTIRFQSDAL